MSFGDAEGIGGSQGMNVSPRRIVVPFIERPRESGMKQVLVSHAGIETAELSDKLFVYRYGFFNGNPNWFSQRRDNSLRISRSRAMTLFAEAMVLSYLGS